ncbi:MAG TPA: ComEC/Rec2 family competence protein [Chloroflexota bacterium]
MATIVAALGWLLGLRVGALAPPLFGAAALALIAGVAALGWLWRRSPAGRLAAVAVVCALLGILRAQAVAAEVGPGTIAAWTDRGRIEVQGRIAAEPERLDRSVRLRVAVERVVAAGGGGPARGDLVALAPPGDWRYGDSIALVGPVERPLDRDAVPAAELLARRGVWATMRAAEARRLDAESRLSLADAARRALYDLKAAAAEALDRRLPAPYAALAGGLLLGGTSGMPSPLVESFQRSGMTHVVAVSGYNIALVVAALLPLVAGGRGVGLLLPALGVTLFTLLVGAPASAVRAALMGGLTLLARQVGRPADPLAALAAAALLMTALDPGLIDDLGFQLSGLATLALVALFPWVDERLRRLGGRGDSSAPTTLGGAVVAGGRELLAATLAVELLTLPVVALTFGRLALLAPLANLLALPVVPLAMLTSLLVVLAGPLPDLLAAPIAWVAWAPLAWIVAVVELCASFGWAAPPLGRLPIELAWGYYALGLFLLLWLHRRSYRAAAPSPAALALRLVDRAPAPLVLGAALLGALAAWAGALQAGAGVLQVTLFEESGAALIRTAGGRALLIDPGPSGRAVAADLGRTLPFWRTDLDVVLLTADRPAATDALPELLRRYRVGQIAHPLATGDGRWREAALASGTALFAPSEGTLVDLGDGATIELLARSDDGLAGLLRLGETRVLLTGALDGGAQRELAGALDGPVDLLWLGQAAALEAALRERADPGLVAQHVGALGRRTAPTALDRLRVLRSDDHGTLDVVMTASGYDIRSRR